MYINGLGRSQWPMTTDKTITEQNSFIDNDGFLQILAAQLKYQDPMGGGEGSGSGDQIMQMSQFAMIEQLTKMSEAVDRLYQLSAAGEAVNMVGKEVTLKTPEGQVTGLVDKVEITEEGNHYWVEGERYAHALIMDVAIGEKEPEVNPDMLLNRYQAPRMQRPLDIPKVSGTVEDLGTDKVPTEEVGTEETSTEEVSAEQASTEEASASDVVQEAPAVDPAVDPAAFNPASADEVMTDEDKS